MMLKNHNSLKNYIISVIYHYYILMNKTKNKIRFSYLENCNFPLCYIKLLNYNLENNQNNLRIQIFYYYDSKLKITIQIYFFLE